LCDDIEPFLNEEDENAGDDAINGEDTEDDDINGEDTGNGEDTEDDDIKGDDIDAGNGDCICFDFDFCFTNNGLLNV